MKFLKFLPILSASLITFGLIYFHVPTNYLQQAIIILMVVLLFLFNRLSSLNNKSLFGIILKTVFILLISLLVQIVVISSGGFYSPFLILIHLFALAISFLLDFESSLAFLIFSLGVLVLHIRFTPVILGNFKDDPWTASLYFISFIVIVPLMHTVSKTYQVKGDLVGKISGYLHISKSREESILKGLNEMVFVTDTSLKIISINQSVEKEMGVLLGDVLGKSLLEVISLTDESGVPLTPDNLYLSQILQDSAERTVQNVTLTSKSRTTPAKVSVQVSPIVGLDKKINQFVIVINDININSFSKHDDLAEAIARNDQKIVEIEKLLAKNGQPNLMLAFTLFKKAEDDLLLSLELEDHPIKQLLNYEDVAYLCNEEVKNNLNLSNLFQTHLNYSLPDSEQAEQSYQKLRETKSELLGGAISYYSIPIDIKWFRKIIEKLLEISILLVDETDKNVNLSLENGEVIKVIISFKAPALVLQYKDDLYEKYYPALRTQTKLSMGSGLEGFIAKMVANQLKIKLSIEVSGPNLLFVLIIDKTPQVIKH